MALGFAPYLLFQSKAVFDGIAPSTKITPVGYTRMLLDNSKPNIVSTGIDDGSGHIRNVTIKYRTRLPKGKSGTTDNCEIDARPAYSETNITATMFRKYAVLLEDDTIAKYEAEASKLMNPGKTALTGVSPLMQEQWDVIMETINGLMQDINDDLVTKQVANFGKNQTTGLASAKTVNFPLSTTTNNLSQGMTMVMSDARLNEMNIENAFIVGSGLIDAYYIQQAAVATAQNGLNPYKLALPKYYNDFDCAGAWGANQFGIFERNAVQLIDINRYVGFKAGMKGGDFFGTLTVPVMDAQGNVSSFTFDIQLTYIKCPTSLVVANENGGDPVTVNRGWALIISKSFDSFNIPTDAYDSTDRLTGNNGTLRYSATNA